MVKRGVARRQILQRSLPFTAGKRLRRRLELLIGGHSATLLREQQVSGQMSRLLLRHAIDGFLLEIGDDLGVGLPCLGHRLYFTTDLEYCIGCEFRCP